MWIAMNEVSFCEKKPLTADNWCGLPVIVVKNEIDGKRFLRETRDKRSDDQQQPTELTGRITALQSKTLEPSQNEPQRLFSEPKGTQNSFWNDGSGKSIAVSFLAL